MILVESSVQWSSRVNPSPSILMLRSDYFNVHTSL
jgi:hypothetical protein